MLPLTNKSGVACAPSRLVVIGLTQLCKLEEIVAAESGYSFGQSAHREFLEATFAFLAVLTKLCHHFHGQREIYLRTYDVCALAIVHP